MKLAMRPSTLTIPPSNGLRTSHAPVSSGSAIPQSLRPWSTSLTFWKTLPASILQAGAIGVSQTDHLHNEIVQACVPRLILKPLQASYCLYLEKHMSFWRRSFHPIHLQGHGWRLLRSGNIDQAHLPPLISGSHGL